ncbi:MAG: acyl-CoA dehydrogenase family protein [Chloroflexi bacterium]|nr:acyl-CoA dehydrogenase family protein [Chloroflexota bacterium]
MDFTYPADVQEFRVEFRRYLDSIATSDLMDELRIGGNWGGKHTKRLWQKLGEDGYFGLGWPKEYGGGGKSLLYLHAFNYEMAYRRFPVPVVTLNTVGPTLIRIGSEEQKKQYLPKILKGEIEFAIGYTEPDAGTDLASLQTSAVRDGDEYVINGQKVFTSGAHHADYLWLAVRTDPDAPKHKGISILIVPLDSEGIEVAPLNIMGGGRSNITYYTDVRVPVSAIVGEENLGWRYITTQLDFERIAISPIAQLERVFDWLCDCARDGRLDASEAWTGSTLVRMAADVNALKVMDMKLASMVANGEVPVHEASLLKVLSNEFRVTFSGEVLQMLGSIGLVRRESPGAQLDSSDDAIERQLRESTILLFGGGSNDVQRDIIATHGLGLPR